MTAHSALERYIRLHYDANTAEGAAYMEPRDVDGTWTRDGVVIRINTMECYTTTHVTLVMDDETAHAVRRAIANAFSRRKREQALCAVQEQEADDE